jgi:molecular chaperone Hsp33
MSKGDRVVRAMLNDGAFRVIAAITTATARGAIEAQGIVGPVGGRLAELLTGAIIIRETTAPGRRVQLVMRHTSGGTLVADSLPTGVSRGLVTAVPESGGAGFSGDAILQVNYTLLTGALHQGVVDVPSGADVSSTLMRYMHQSEQTVSMVVVEALLEDDRLVASGGYLVQLLPEATPTVIDAMTERLASLEHIGPVLASAEPSPNALIETLFAGFEHTELADSALEFGCTCSEERVLAGIISLPHEDVREMADTSEPVEVRCDACGRRYEIEPATLRALSLRREGEAKD